MFPSVFLKALVGLAGSALQGVGHDDLLFRVLEGIRSPVTRHVAENEAGFVVFPGLQKGRAELQEGLGGGVGPGPGFTDFFRFPLDFFHPLGSGSGFADLGVEGVQLGAEAGKDLLFPRNGAQPLDGFGITPGVDIEGGELKRGFGGNGRTARIGQFPVNLTCPCRGGLRLRLLEIGHQFLGATGLREGLHPVDFIQVELVLVRLSGQIQGLAGLGVFSQQQVETGLKEQALRAGLRLRIFLEEGADPGEGLLVAFLSLRGLFRRPVGLASGDQGQVEGDFLLDLLFLGGGGLFIGSFCLRPPGKAVKGAGLIEINQRQVGGLRVGLDEVAGKLGALLKAVGKIGFLEILQRGLLILGEKPAGEGSQGDCRHARQDPNRFHETKMLRAGAPQGRAEPAGFSAFFPLIPAGFWMNDFPLMILNENAPEGLAA